jgi:hypothetical protein
MSKNDRIACQVSASAEDEVETSPRRGEIYCMAQKGNHFDCSGPYPQGKVDVEGESGQLPSHPQSALVPTVKSIAAYYKSSQRRSSFAAGLPEFQRQADGDICAALEFIQRTEEGLAQFRLR